MLHDPAPRDVPVGVIRGDAAAQTLMSAVRSQSDAMERIEYADPAAAVAALERGAWYAVVGSTDASGGTGPTLTTPSASSPTAADVVVDTLTGVADTAQVPITVADAVPVSSGDPRGLVPFYLVVGLVLAGYLASTALGITLGTAPRGFDRAAMRIGVLAVFPVLACGRCSASAACSAPPRCSGSAPTAERPPRRRPIRSGRARDSAVLRDRHTRGAFRD